MTKIQNLRNIAIIAHVDHGKTTLVDAMFKESGLYRKNEQIENRVMDSSDLEKERGITILAKNTSVRYNGIKINIIDTPGHADFGGEVERVLKMVNGVLLVVDAYDGPMPQTRFVLKKALELKLVPLVVINKIDRPDARPSEVADMIFELFMELGADDDQLEFPIIYTSAKDGISSQNIAEAMSAEHQGFTPLLDAIVESIPCPEGDIDAPLQLLISNVDVDSYVGRIAVGRIIRGKITKGAQVVLCKYNDSKSIPAKVVKLMEFEGLGKSDTDIAEVGEIVCVAGIEAVEIGDTICDPGTVEPLEYVSIDEPTISMNFSVNNSPFAGMDGTYVTSRHLRDRLFKEIKSNVSMRLEETESPDSFVVKGRGELHLSILIETMRRQGYEFQVSRPRVIVKETEKGKLEPVELVMVDVPEEFVGVVIEKLGSRRAELVNMMPPEKGYTRLEFKIPTRGLIGYRSEFLSDTRGNGIINSIIVGFEPWKGELANRSHGVLVAWENGEAVTYGLYHAQERGNLFIGPGTKVYQGMIVGSNPRNEDVVVNVCKKKHVTNIRASGTDDALRLVPTIDMSLEQCLEFISDDELVEITPINIRLRKRVLNNDLRGKMRNKSQ